MAGLPAGTAFDCEITMEQRSATTQTPAGRDDRLADLYVTGGRQRTLVETEEWRQYGQAVIVRVDTAMAAAEPCVEYVSPPEVCPDEEPSISFKSASVHGDRLYVCTSTEVLVYALPGFEVVNYVSLPCFNDLHHVQPTADGTLLVANTGLDMVVEVSERGESVREWNVLGRDPWAQFSRHVDYRKVATTKPHKAHPNHVFQVDGQIWVTRFQQRDAVCLNAGDHRMPIDIQSPHDGARCGGFVYFTTVDGHVVVVDERTHKVEDVIDLNDREGSDAPLGWCRGLSIADPSRAWVGFSRFRPTRFVENVRWIKSGFQRRRKPTHIALYDLITRRRLCEIDVESLGLHTVFSIVEAPASA